MNITLEEALSKLENAKVVFSKAQNRYFYTIDRSNMARHAYEDAFFSYVKYGNAQLFDLYHSKLEEYNRSLIDVSNSHSYLKISQVKLKKATRTVKKLQRLEEKRKRKEEKQNTSNAWFN